MCACRPAPAEKPSEEAGQQAPPAFVGKAWIAVDPSAAPGALRSFLPDGTLIMDSCFETYRLARWRTLGEGVVQWDEDGAQIRAEVTFPSPEELELRLELRNEVKVERYRLAKGPYVCPDLPR